MNIKKVSLQEAKKRFKQHIIWIDLEIDPTNQNLLCGGLGCFINDIYYTVIFYECDLKDVLEILISAKCIAGHNIYAFDLPWLQQRLQDVINLEYIRVEKCIDTLLLANLVYPHRPSQALLKLYKVQTTINDPTLDCLEAFQLYQKICDSWQNEVHPQIVLWTEEKLPFDSILPDIELKHVQPYQELIPQGQYSAFISWLETLEFKSLSNLGAIVFAHWLLHLEQPSCRRPSWLQDLSEYGEQFTQAEQIFWSEQEFKNIDFNQESQYFFGYPLREGQHKIIHTLVQAEQTPIGLLPTGGGKSLTFQLPALVLSRYRRELTVIISPLKALMEDQVMGLQALGHWGNRAACLISGQSEEEQSKILEGIWSGSIDLLYISPERLRTHTMQTLLSRRRPALWVMDEAHTLSQWGTDFRPDFLRIGRLIAKCYRDQNATPPYLMLVTATASKRAIEQIEAEVIQPLNHVIGLPSQVVTVEEKQQVWRDNISTDYIELDASQRLPEIRKILNEIFPTRRSDAQVNIEDLDPQHPIVLIYVRSRNKTEEFAQELALQGFLVEPYHAGMSANDKQAVLEKFKNHQLDVVVCTNAFGMGIDRATIHTVIHYSPPNNLESYLQEIGRAARKNGETGRAILFWSKQDLNYLVRKNIESEIGGHKVLGECWTQVISKVLKRDAKERWFTAQELQGYLAFDGEDLVTQIRVILLALERYNLLVEKEQLPALLSLKLINPPANQEGQVAELYRRLVPITQQENTQLYLPEVSVVLGMSVRRLLNAIRQLVKLGCACWACEVQIRLTESHQKLRRKFQEKKDALDALESCWQNYPPEDAKRVDLRSLDQWFIQHQKRVKAREIFYIFKHFKILKLKENKYSLRLEAFEHGAKWTDWLAQAKQHLNQLSESLALILRSVPEVQAQHNYILKIEQLVEEEQIDAEVFLKHLEYMQSFGWMNVSRLDDESQKIFFIDPPSGEDARQRLHPKTAYRYLEQHYQDRNRRLHILSYWLGCDLDTKKKIIDDYFHLNIQEVCKKYLPDPELAKQAHLEDFESKILPKYLSPVQREIISDDQRRAMLVLAGPGSGKTTIIVHRVANLVMCANISAEKILILAYNRQAVYEIRQRLIKLIGIEHASSIHVFTFHGLARHLTNISENQAPHDANPDFKYQWLLQQAIEYLAEHPQYFQYILVDEFQDIDDLQYQMISHLAGLQLESESEKTIIQGSLDLDELPIDYHTQDDISQRAFLVAVGDDDQNLYGFRGANIGHIRNFQKDFYIGEDDIFYLIDNYRSPTDVIELANQYIQQSLPAEARLKGHEHAIKPFIQQGRQEQGNIRFGLYQQTHGLDAISWIVNDIQAKKDSLDAKWSDFAVLARQWSELLVIQHYLREAGIHYQMVNQNNQIEITDSFIVKHFLEELQQKPALDIIDGHVRDYFTQWAHTEGFNLNDLSYRQLQRRFDVEHYTNLTCQQIIDIIELIPDQTNPNMVVLSTYHSAKGSEYDHVYIYDQWYGNLNKQDQHNDVRAMYVALTRAKQSLTLIQPQHTNNKQHCDNNIRQLMSKAQLLQFKSVQSIQEITYFYPLGLADIYLSNPILVREIGRRNIESFAKNPNLNLVQDLKLILKTGQYGNWIDITSNTYGEIGRLSKACTQYLTRYDFHKMTIECCGMYIIDFYQSDLDSYQKAGYTGDAHSHYVVIPYLRIQQAIN